MSKSLAIAYNMKRKGKKMAEGGEAKSEPKPEPTPQIMDPEEAEKAQGSMRKAFGYAKGGEVRKVHPGMEDQGSDYKNDQTRNKVDMSGGQRAESGHHWGKYQGQAQNEKGVHTPVSGVTGFPGGKGTSRAGSYTKDKYGGKPLFSLKDKGGHPAVAEHKKVLSEMKTMPKPKLQGLAEGGEVYNEEAMMEDDKDLNQKPVGPHDSLKDDLVDRIMKKLSPSFEGEAKLSEGGQVANDTHQFEDDFSDPNEFDDLVLRDDLEEHYTGANSGDEIGNAQEDEDRKDMVSRIMASRKKKDKNPTPA